jgi:hypothetical protein
MHDNRRARPVAGRCQARPALPKTAAATMPPGLVTRTISFMARAGSGMGQDLVALSTLWREDRRPKACG